MKNKAYPTGKKHWAEKLANHNLLELCTIFPLLNSLCMISLKWKTLENTFDKPNQTH
jgi:hypothetical protein